MHQRIIFANAILKDAIKYDIAVLGEAANNVSKEFAAKHPEIQFKPISGMRHKVIHGYENVDEEIIWDTVVYDIPELIAALKTLLATL